MSSVRLSTSLRSRPATETADIAVRLMPMLGISDVTDVTPLDRLGLPVFFSNRPGGLTRRVHSGKGASLADAYVGALMEAVEFATAESASAVGADTWLPARMLVEQLPDGLDLADFAPRLGREARSDYCMPAVRCEDVAAGTQTLLPAELVLVPCPAHAGSPFFGWSTNGLASGNSLDEATLHALLEVLERDTIAMNLPRDESCLIDNADIPEPFKTLADDWQRLGIELIVRFVPNEFGLPCFEAGIHDGTSPDLKLARGRGLHLDRSVALSRAVCEAAQVRLTAMHGGRYDLPPVEPEQAGDGPNKSTRLLARLKDATRRIDFEEVPQEICLSVRSALKQTLARLAESGMTRVFRRRMHFGSGRGGLLGLHVVKVIVPRCESAVGSQVRMGPRLAARILARR